MSRFISSGTNDEPTARDEAWLKAQAELDAAHAAKLEAGKQEGGKSLYETLQANKGDSFTRESSLEACVPADESDV